MVHKIVVSTVIVEEMAMTLSELCQACSVENEYVIDLVTEGILDPTLGDIQTNLEFSEVDQWYFTGNSMKRVRMTLRLQRDLEVNLAGAALMLDMMEELGRL